MNYEQIQANIENNLYESERDFLQDLIDLYELDANDPLVSRLYGKAIQSGYLLGLDEVLVHFGDLVDIFYGDSL